MKAQGILHLQAITPLQPGTGQASGVIDLPISRERCTGLPQVPASSIKGVLRSEAGSNLSESELETLFGRQERAGALLVGDQRLLCLAVRSVWGTFALATSSLILSRFARDLQMLGYAAPWVEDLPAPVGSSAAAGGSTLLAREDAIQLEDLRLQAEHQWRAGAQKVAEGLASQVCSSEAERKFFLERFVMLPDDLMTLLAETATEVSARIRLETDTKTVASGGLWYEEYVPAESLFAGPLLTASDQSSSLDKLLSSLDGTMIQIGGGASTGRGLCHCRVWRGG